MSTCLVIPDAHATPGISNDRFLYLGRYIVHKKPDLIVCLGDMADMASLSKYDIGKKKAEGQRYEADLEAVWEANELLWQPLHEFNKQELRAGRAPYLPQRELTLGNHEYRIERAANDEPKLWGWLTVDDLKYDKSGWNVTPYLKSFVQDNVVYSHLFTAGLMDRPMSGVNHARQLTLKDGRSYIQGHTHELKVHFEGRGKPRWGIVAGCYFTHAMDYVSDDAQKAWWRGVTILHNLDGSGNFDPLFVPMHYIESKFS